MSQKQRLGKGPPDLQLVTVPLRPLLDDAWTEVSTYLGEALRMQPSARDAWLEDLKHRDPAFAAEIERHVAELAALLQQEEGEPIDAAVPPVVPQATRSGAAKGTQPRPRTQALAAQSWAPAAGQRLGAYTLECPIGHGGMGSVWLASRTDGRYEGRVAIKLMNAATRTYINAERITREGQILAKLSHPNIARLLDAGVTAYGQPYLVLEYVDGEEIDRYCNSHLLSIEERIVVFLDVLAAVQHAHSQLILHRDLKPSNVLVTEGGGVRLLDFGVGKLLDSEFLDAEGSEGSMTSRNTTLFCTPAYAAPEQVQSGLVSTTATDVYALGVMLYVLLSGRHPTSSLCSTPLEQMRAVVEQDAPRLSESAVSKTPPLPGFQELSRRAARKLRGDLDNILAKALQKSPADRYGTVRDFAADLQRFLNHEPVEAQPDSAGYRMDKFIRRNRGAVAAAAAVFVALLVGVTATTWQARQASLARQLAESQRHVAEEQRGEALFEARNARASQELLGQIFGDAVKNGDDPRMRFRLDRARELLAKRYAQDPRIYGSLLLQLAGRYEELGDKDQAAQLRGEFKRLSARTGDSSLQANAECMQAYNLVGAGQPQAAAGHLARGFDYMQKAQQEWAESGSECYHADAMLALTRGDHAWAAKQMSTWVATLEKQGLAQTRSYLTSLSSLADIQQQSDDLPAALRSSQRVLELSETLNGTTDPLATGANFNRLAEILFGLGRLHEALSTDSQLEKSMRADGSAVPLFIRVQMARRASAAGLPGRALELLREVRQRSEQNDAAALHALPVLIEAELLNGDHTGATRDLIRYDGLAKGTHVEPLENLDVNRLRLQLALAYGSSGRTNPHLAVLRSALDTAMQDGSLPRVALLNAHLASGQGALAAFSLDDAHVHADLALSMAQSEHTGDQASAWVGGARLLQAKIDVAAGNSAEAAPAFADARQQLRGSVEPQQAWRVDAEKAADPGRAALDHH